MTGFLKYVSIACLALLSWWQTDLHAHTPGASAVLIAAAVATAYLINRSHRIGFWLGMILGLGYTAETIWRLGAHAYATASPLLAWSCGLTAATGWLAWSSREKRRPKSKYERPW